MNKKVIKTISYGDDNFFGYIVETDLAYFITLQSKRNIKDGTIINHNLGLKIPQELANWYPCLICTSNSGVTSQYIVLEENSITIRIPSHLEVLPSAAFLTGIIFKFI